MKRLQLQWRGMSHEDRMLRFIQPALIGLIDGVISSIAPLLGAAYYAGAHAALVVGFAAALGAAISMGLSEGLSDDGSVTGRGAGAVRGSVTGGATFIGGVVHVLPFFFADLNTALIITYCIIACELVGIAWIRRRFLNVPIKRSLIQITLGGIIVAIVGILLGHS